MSVLKEYVMRFLPAAIALSMLAAVSASMGQARPYQADPRAVALVEQGRAQLKAGETDAAVGLFESALAVDPGYSAVYVELANAARAENLQGKAIQYYRAAQERDPDNLTAISGEGAALVEKGAVEKARRNLTKLESMCGAACPQTKELSAAIAKGPTPQVLTAEVVVPDPVVTKN